MCEKIYLERAGRGVFNVWLWNPKKNLAIGFTNIVFRLRRGELGSEIVVASCCEVDSFIDFWGEDRELVELSFGINLDILGIHGGEHFDDLDFSLYREATGRDVSRWIRILTVVWLKILLSLLIYPPRDEWSREINFIDCFHFSELTNFADVYNFIEGYFERWLKIYCDREKDMWEIRHYRDVDELSALFKKFRAVVGV